MKFGFTVKGYRAEVDISVLQHKALFNFQVQAADPPALARISMTALTLSVTVGISAAAPAAV